MSVVCLAQSDCLTLDLLLESYKLRTLGLRTSFSFHLPSSSLPPPPQNQLSSTQTLLMNTEPSVAQPLTMDASTPKVNFDNFTDIDYIFDMAELANNELDSGLLAGLNAPV